MQLECIVTLASPEVRLRFNAMERSLRATGCDLPLRVIPYNDGRFDLPPNAEWWLDVALADWLREWKAPPTMRKYQCLTIPNFQFVDADVVFLRNPAEALKPLEGFITSCGHWKNPNETLTAQSLSHFAMQSTNWQTQVFNTGQWACDRALFTRQSLRKRCESPDFKKTCLTFPHHEQPGVNLLVSSTDVPVHNLTLPPWNMQSTWAGDYSGDFQQFWKTPDETPYLIHWAGCRIDERRPIDCLMEQFLTPTERQAWALQVQQVAARREEACRSFRGRVGRLKRACRQFMASLHSP
jgi:hypothetical protein